MTFFWIGVASRDHVRTGVAGGFAQLGHGKEIALRSIGQGDWIAYYSPRSALRGGKPVQAFTAIGRVASEMPYRVATEDNFAPFRLDVDYRQDGHEAPIRPLLERLELTKDYGSKWGIVFRRSKIKVSRNDFRLVAEAMRVETDI